jgi:hypothetical protein
MHIDEPEGSVRYIEQNKTTATAIGFGRTAEALPPQPVFSARNDKFT